MNKNYTVKDVARITGMTERTIRNYLKEGILKGTKIGGQWRFNDESLKNLVDNSTFRNKLQDKASAYAKDYIDKKFIIDGDITVCSIVDYQNENQEYMDKLECEILKIAKEYKGNVKLTAISQNGYGRLTLVGSLECTKRILDVISMLKDNRR